MFYVNGIKSTFLLMITFILLSYIEHCNFINIVTFKCNIPIHFSLVIISKLFKGNKNQGDIKLFCNVDAQRQLSECFHLRKQSQIVTLLEVDYVTLSVTVASFPSRSCEKERCGEALTTPWRAREQLVAPPLNITGVQDTSCLYTTTIYTNNIKEYQLGLNMENVFLYLSYFQR